MFDFMQNTALVNAFGAFFTALIIMLISTKPFIKILNKLRYGQQVRQDGPKAHLEKQGTPTMGGVLILLAIVISSCLWGNIKHINFAIALLVTLSFGIIGGIDDGLKIFKARSKGLSAKQKYLAQSGLALIVAVFLYFSAQTPADTQLLIPFFKQLLIPLSILYILLAYFVIVGTSNAVNLTDGLDGLAAGPVIIITLVFTLVAIILGEQENSTALSLPFLVNAKELAVFSSAVAGATCGFLWFNTYPAQIFMGDVGSLSLGAAIGILAVLLRQELALFVMGFVFVLETLSVIIQVGVFKLKHKRVFKMAPIHHHFELLGWHEAKITTRAWLVSLFLATLILLSLII